MTEDKPVNDTSPVESGDASEENWSRDMLARVALAGVAEQRRARRWGIFFKSLGFAYLIAILLMFAPGLWERGAGLADAHVALVNIEGVIAPGADSNADDIIAGVREAFEDDNTRAVVLRVNSPGGSPVQSDLIYREVRRLQGERDNVPVYTVIEDLGASGGYYVAVAGERIFANQSSIVGSIGVRFAGGFGFVEALERLGVERRVHTAGGSKDFMDPFLPERPEQVAHLQALLDSIHGEFISAVRDSRGERLQGEPSYLFSGLMWTGQRALELGLIDGFGDHRYVARELVGVDRVVDFSRQRSLWERLASSAAAQLAGALGIAAGAGDVPLPR